MLNNRLDPSGRKGLKRGSYCKQDDKLTLFRIIEKYKRIVLSKRTDWLTNKRKNEAWQRITTEFNSISYVPKNEEQLKNIYRNKVSEIKRLISKGEFDRLTSEYKPFLEFFEDAEKNIEDGDNLGQIKQEVNGNSRDSDDGDNNAEDDDNDDDEDEDDEDNERDDIDILLTEIREGPTPTKLNENNDKNESGSSQSSIGNERNTHHQNGNGDTGIRGGMGYYDNPNIRHFQYLNQQEFNHHRNFPLFNGDFKQENRDNNVQMKVRVNWRNQQQQQEPQQQQNSDNPEIQEIKIKIMQEHLEQERLKRKILEEKLKIHELKRKKIEKCFRNYCKQTAVNMNNRK